MCRGRSNAFHHVSAKMRISSINFKEWAERESGKGREHQRSREGQHKVVFLCWVTHWNGVHGDENDGFSGYGA